MDKRRKKRKEVRREEGREADRLEGWSRRLEGIMDGQWPLAQGSASAGAWYLILFGYKNTEALPSSYKVSLNHLGDWGSWGSQGASETPDHP